ncbi:olfactory receptor 2D3-like [Sphaerodactylus townsendi]|uniref:olfactory receptor 2D3-like n=1 Tax=Sphaerodactylus townsendi TaxID=933632 RepID=UPI002026AC42|nr:olfactory receptor 2D3-like [Sphaerodactylus townsendi]
MGAENFTSVSEFLLVGLSSDQETHTLLFVAILFIYSITLVGNLGIILLVLVDSHLHTPMYFFLTHLSGIEICYITSTIPQMLAHLQTGHGGLSLIRCALQMYVALSLGSTEALLLGVMAYDRYLAICHPLTYATVMGRWRQIQLASACWVGGFFGSVICVFLTFTHPFCGSNLINHFMCELPAVLKLACGDIRNTETVVFLLAAMVILGPLSIILTSYWLILFSVSQMQSARGLRKAFSTCGSHLTVVTLFYGTTTFIYIVPQSGASLDNRKRIAVFYVVVTPFLNPIIYTLRNKDVHEATAKVVRRLCCKPRN